MHNIPVTLKLAKKVIPDLQRSNGSLVVIPVVVLRECEPEHSYTLTELFNMYLKEFCFPDCSEVSSIVPVFNNVGERSAAKNYRLVVLLSVVSKIFEKLVNIGLVITLRNETMVSCLLAQLQIFRRLLVSDRIARAFNKSEATWPVALDIFKSLNEVRHVGLLHRLKSYGFSYWVFGFISYFLSNRKLARVSSQCWSFSGIHSWSYIFPNIH